MARDRFMQVQVFGVPDLARGQVVGVDVEDARTRAVLARRVVLAAGRGLLAERFDRTDLERRLRITENCVGIFSLIFASRPR